MQIQDAGMKLIFRPLLSLLRREVVTWFPEMENLVPYKELL